MVSSPSMPRVGLCGEPGVPAQPMTEADGNRPGTFLIQINLPGTSPCAQGRRRTQKCGLAVRFAMACKSDEQGRCALSR
jgi:hypothetical protein